MGEGKLKNCIVTGELFHDTKGSDIHPDVLEEMAERDDYHEKLTKLKEFCRDLESDGDLITINDAARKLDIERELILGFIYRGDIDTYAFDDPKVREFKRQRQKYAAGGGPGPSSGGGKGLRFHTRSDDGD